MDRPRVLISVPITFRGHAPARERLEQAGCEVVEVPAGLQNTAAVREALEGIFAVLAGMEPLQADSMAEATDLRIIARNGVGYDSIDLEYCTRRGIIVTNTPGALSDAVAEETIGLMLALTRHITAGDRSVKSGGYEVPFGEDLAAMTLGVIGGGSIGCEVIARALAFKMRVLVCDPYADAGRIRGMGASLVSLDELLPAADIVTLHLPLNEASRGMVNAGFLQRMKPGSYLINTARGAVVDEAALRDALLDGQLAGAGLDVQVSEPATGLSRALLELDNVVGMPHAGSKTLTTRERMSMWAAESIIDVLAGRQPEHVVNREVLERLSLQPRGGN